MQVAAIRILSGSLGQEVLCVGRKKGLRIYTKYKHSLSRDGSVGTEIKLRTGRLRVLLSGMGNRFLFSPKYPHRLRGPHISLFNVLGISSRGGREGGSESSRAGAWI